MKLESLKLRTMYSGNLNLALTEHIGWETFPRFATELLDKIGGKVIDKAEAVDIRIWYVEIESYTVLLVYEDYPGMVSIESQDEPGNKLIKRLYTQLKEINL